MKANHPLVRCFVAMLAWMIISCSSSSSGTPDSGIDQGVAAGDGNGSSDQQQDRPFSGPLELVAVTTGSNHTCALRTDRTLWCWGANKEGQLGTGDRVDRAVPTQEQTKGTDWASVAAAGQHTCAIKEDGTLWCWGTNESGQIGDGNIGVSRDSPVDISSSKSWQQVACSTNQSCAVTTNRQVYCWGQVGPSSSSPLAPTPRSATGGKKVAPSHVRTVVLRSDGTLWIKGVAKREQTTLTYKQFVQIRDSDRWVDLVGGDWHSCALRDDSTLWCWGPRDSAQIGATEGMTLGAYYPKQEATGATNWSSVAASQNRTCTVKDDGTLWCWGDNLSKACGTGDSDTHGQFIWTPLQEATLATDWRDVATGGGHTCAFKRDGRLLCWGSNVNGQLGIDSTDESNPVSTPTEVLQPW